MADKAPVRPDRSREALFRQLTLINGGVVYLYEIDRAQRLDQTKLPRYLADLLGYPEGHPKTVVQGGMLELFHPNDRSLVDKHLRAAAALSDGEFATITFRMQHFDGAWRWLEARERVFSRGHDGVVRRMLGFASDVSERRRLTDSLAGATEALLLAEAHERRRIGRELHDSTTQHLVAIDLTMSRLEQRLGDDPTDQAIVQDIRSALTAAHREIRTFSYLLHPPDLARVGLEAALNQFLDGFQRRTGLRVRFQVKGPRRALGQHGELGLFRLAQEALMNVHRHAHATQVDMRLTHRPTETILEVGDDGVGLSEAEIAPLLSGKAAGIGVASMKARIEDLGGALEILPQPKGLLVRATMPRRRADDALPPPHVAAPEDRVNAAEPSVAAQ